MKFIFRPLNKMIFSQNFGENKGCIDITTGTKVISCDGLNPPAGYKSVYSNMKGHNGLDLSAQRGTPIYAAQDGYVEEYVAEEKRGLGLGIVTERKHYCQETGQDEYFKIRYWHNLTNLVKKGEKVKIGQIIALVDNTGYSGGDHLHFEVKPVKISKTGKVSNILQDNGYFGAVDPLPYLLPQSASLFSGAKNWVDRLLIALKLFTQSR